MLWNLMLGFGMHGLDSAGLVLGRFGHPPTSNLVILVMLELFGFAFEVHRYPFPTLLLGFCELFCTV